MDRCPPIVALVDKPKSAYAFWRIVRPYARLREIGVDAQVCWLDADEMPTLPIDGRVVVLQRAAARVGDPDGTRRWIDALRAAGARALVYELDDDIISPAFTEYLMACGGLELVGTERLEAERQAAALTLSLCDGVTVSTQALADVVHGYIDRPVHVVQNAIDVEWFRARLTPRSDWYRWLTVGWAGGRRPEADLEPMAVAWGRIARRYPDVRFVVAGWQPDCIYREVDDLDRIIRVPWAELDDWPRSMQVDIGCAPLADTPFNRAKSPIKAWEYALAGAAVVASWVEPYRHGNIGLGTLVGDAEDWDLALANLLDHRTIRSTVSRSLRAYVERDHALSARSLARWTDAYAALAGVTA